MTTLDVYVKDFFRPIKELDTAYGQKQGFAFLESSIENFLNYESTDNAFNVYSSFFDIYQVTDRKNKTAFLNLVDIIKMYEQNAARFTDSQRDHFIHSVNVFVLGLSIYASNKTYRESFAGVRPRNNVFESDDERFLYCWGLSALIHDVGYPVEIASNQVNRFVKYISSIDHEDPSIKGAFRFRDFEELRFLERGNWESIAGGIKDSMGYPADADIFDSYSLLSYPVSEMVGLDHETVYGAISSFPEAMSTGMFVDHAFYSTLIILKWMGHIYQKYGESPYPFYGTVTDVASAILLHNFYRWVFTKEPYRLGPLDVRKAPLAYMMILCDELQEWNRKSYGFKTPDALPENSTIYINEDRIHVDYRTTSVRISETFSEEKEKLLYTLLDIEAIFPAGLDVLCTCENSADVLLDDLRNNCDSATPAPLLDNIISLAIEIHNQYNRERKREFPDEELEYPDWDSLAQDLKYSNITQAKDIPVKLSRIGCSMVPSDDPRPAVREFSDSEILAMSILEHMRWVNERKSNGWVYGDKKDVPNRRSPYIVPWDKLPDNIKEYDSEAVRNIIRLLGTIGLKVVRNHD